MKILATDFDGTLRQGPTIGSKNINAIEKWRDSGNLFGIVTGRSLCSIMREIRNENLICDFIIANNGAIICDGQGVIISEISVDGAILPELTAYFREIKVNFCSIFCLEKEFSTDDTDVSSIKKFNQISIMVNSLEEASDAIAEVKKRFGDYLSSHQNGVYLDFNHAGLSKSIAVSELIKIKNISRTDMITAGDNLNDLAMIRDFKGCAVKNAVPEVREAASAVFDDIAGIIESHINCP